MSRLQQTFYARRVSPRALGAGSLDAAVAGRGSADARRSPPPDSARAATAAAPDISRCTGTSPSPDTVFFTAPGRRASAVPADASGTRFGTVITREGATAAEFGRARLVRGASAFATRRGATVGSAGPLENDELIASARGSFASRLDGESGTAGALRFVTRSAVMDALGTAPVLRLLPLLVERDRRGVRGTAVVLRTRETRETGFDGEAGSVGTGDEGGGTEMVH